MLAIGIFWPDIFGINAGASDPGEGQVERLASGGMNRLGEFQLRLGVDGLQFPQRVEPVFIKVRRLGIRAGVGLEFVEWFVEAGHGSGVIKGDD